MARIVEEHIVIKVSKLVRGNGKAASALPEGIVEMLEGVASEIINDPSAVVEVIVGDDSHTDEE